jgi:hypothetical protein
LGEFIIQPAWTGVANAPWTGVSGKEDEHDMAKTTRKTEPATAAKKPASRTKAGPAAGAEKATARRQAKTEAANAEPPARQGFASEPTHDEIALRAWSIYERRGRSHGRAMSDWLEAKTQLILERGIKP